MSAASTPRWATTSVTPTQSQAHAGARTCSASAPPSTAACDRFSACTRCIRSGKVVKARADAAARPDAAHAPLHCNRVDLDACAARQRRHTDRGAGRKRRAEDTPVDLVHPREVREIHQIDRRPHDVRRRPGRPRPARRAGSPAPARSRAPRRQPPARRWPDRVRSARRERATARRAPPAQYGPIACGAAFGRNRFLHSAPP